MKVVCAWCGRDMGQGAKMHHAEGQFVSHGICSECAENVEFQLGVSIKKFLNSFDMPVIMVDHDGRAITANSAALKLVNKDLAAIKHAMLGNILDCAYSVLPGGCGADSLCCACTIRRAVKNTFDTGASCINLPATIARDLNGEKDGTLQISTEKALNYVLLRIAPAGSSVLQC